MRLLTDLRNFLLRDELSKDLRWGGGWGILAGAVYSGVAVFIASQPDVRGLVHPGLLVVGYFGVSIPMGLLVGLLRPLTEFTWGAAFVGGTVGAFLYSMGAFVAVPYLVVQPDSRGYIVTALCGFGFGALAGLWIHHD